MPLQQQLTFAALALAPQSICPGFLCSQLNLKPTGRSACPGAQEEEQKDQKEHKEPAEGTKAILEFVAEPCGFCGTSHCFSHSILVAPCGSLLLLVDSTTA